jgi:uncharacterized repeat protein (TIGR01451 family)
LPNSHTTILEETGMYVIEETATDGWTLDNVDCTGSHYRRISDTEVVVSTIYGSEINCTFTNVKLGKVTIVKDAGPDSSQPFTFSQNIDESGDFSLVDDGTNTANSKTFENVYPGMYGISEHDLDGWRLADYTCDNWRDWGEERTPAPLDTTSYEEYYDDYVYVAPGEEVTCTYTNEQTVLFLEKTNNRPNPTTVGDTVTYNLEVSIPEGAADLSNVVVTDLAPENFKYVAGSWTAFSSVRGDLKVAGITTEPTYHSPGQWQLGNMVDGEVVTLTYQAVIQNIVSPGTYPDIAYANGFTDDEELIFDNLSATDTPFVGTVITVLKDVKPVVVTQLAYTGNAVYGYVLVPMIMILLTLLGAQATRRNTLKGGK